MEQISADMSRVIDDCLRCYRTCADTAAVQLDAMGELDEPLHFRLVLATAESCRSLAHIMILGVPRHEKMCAACAELCDACAEACMAAGELDACVEACRTCAATCRALAYVH